MDLNPEEKITTIEIGGFDPPEPGVSACQFDEGVTLRTNENSGKTTLQLPLEIIKALEGPEENIGKKFSHFCPIETKFGEKQLAGILHVTGLVGMFAEKFDGKVDPLDDRFINTLKLKLPGKLVKVAHQVRKDNKGRDQVDITKIGAYTKGVKPEAAPTSDEW